MKSRQRTLFTIGCFCTILALSACSNVKEYQKNKLNDSEMQLSARKSQQGEQNFQSYREGAAGANGGKSGGGCGCN